jgi:hypothetical protein
MRDGLPVAPGGVGPHQREVQLTASRHAACWLSMNSWASASVYSASASQENLSTLGCANATTFSGTSAGSQGRSSTTSSARGGVGKLNFGNDEDPNWLMNAGSVWAVVEIVTLADRPDLLDAMWALRSTWPEFMLNDPVGNRLFPLVPEMFPEYQLLAVNEIGTVIGRIVAAPFHWGGSEQELPIRGWDAIPSTTTTPST